MAPRTTGKIARARIVAPNQLQLFGSPADRLRAALKPGFRDERYGRLWRLGQIHEKAGNVHGHLGFGKQVDADLWDEDVQDFEPTEVPNGVASPFVIRLADLAMVFQPRKQDIRVTSFTGALRSMLRTATTEHRWDVRSLTGDSTFEQWRSTVDAVTRLRFRIEEERPRRPVPSELMSLVAQTDSESATIDLRAKDGLDTRGPLVQEILGHVRDGYGELVAVGRQGDAPDVECVWASALGGESLVTEVPVNSVTGEADFDTLVCQLATIDIAPDG